MDRIAFDLAPLENDFKVLKADKKKTTLKPLEFILQLNQNIKIDEILLRQAYHKYPNKKDLQKAKTCPQYTKFFKHLIDNMDSIEENYLKQSTDQKQIEEVSSQNHKEYNYLLNKNNISKFIRDQSVHYQNTIDKYLQESQEAQKGIKTKKMHLFFIDLFKNQYTTIIQNHVAFLAQGEEQIVINIGKILMDFAQQSKDMTAQQAQSQFLINQEQILDFLTFWLKQNNDSLFVLYARTAQRLQKQSKLLQNKSNLQIKTHPSRMTKDEITLKEKQQEEAGDIIEQQPLQKSQELQKVESIEVQYKREQTPIKIERSFDNNSALALLRSKFGEDPAEKIMIEQPKKELTRQELLQKQMKGLFDFGCKRRYKLNKNTTFDDLEHQLTNMNLQKFMNFCNFFELQKIIDRNLIIDYFKLLALNGRTIDYSRFQQIINRLAQTDQRLYDNLLNKVKYEVKSKQNQISQNKKTESKLSGYKFKLRPINGKDITSIERELTFKKLEKQIGREEKDHKALVKRQNFQKTKDNMKSISHLGSSRLQVSRFEPVKEPAFNPEKLISFQKDNDDLWDAYQAKIWKKQTKQTHTTLEDILSRRMKKGNNIINKINSQRSLLYD